MSTLSKIWGIACSGFSKVMGTEVANVSKVEGFNWPQTGEDSEGDDLPTPTAYFSFESQTNKVTPSEVGTLELDGWTQYSTTPVVGTYSARAALDADKTATIAGVNATTAIVVSHWIKCSVGGTHMTYKDESDTRLTFTLSQADGWEHWLLYQNATETKYYKDGVLYSTTATGSFASIPTLYMEALNTDTWSDEIAIWSNVTWTDAQALEYADRIANYGYYYRNGEGWTTLAEEGLPNPTWYWTMDTADNLVETITGEYLSGSGTGGFTSSGALYGEMWSGQLQVSTNYPELFATNYDRLVVAFWAHGNAEVNTLLESVPVNDCVVSGASAPISLYVEEFNLTDTDIDEIHVGIGEVGAVDEMAIFVDPPSGYTTEYFETALAAGNGVVWRSGAWYEIT
jgi:hypothetical protein